MMRVLFICILLLIGIPSVANSKQEIFDFEFEGVSLNGILNFPTDSIPKGIVLIVHGSGQTNAVAQNWYSDVRESILRSGYATYMWDKMGCGASGGRFDYNQTVYNSALEVIAAITALKENKVAGSSAIGLWGISRAGWINPIVIREYKDIKFWISVSGVDGQENFKYLLAENLKINGHPPDSVDLLVNEWLMGTKITHAGGSFEAYRQATTHLAKNPFWLRFTNGGISEQGFYTYQQTFKKEVLDPETGLQVYIEDFGSILSGITCPVLAVFGENDRNVDWNKTKRLYENTLGKNTDLSVVSFPNCNHNLFQSQTGGFYEMEDGNLSYTRCFDFLNAMEAWLAKI